MPAEAVRQPEELQKSGYSGFGKRLFSPFDMVQAVRTQGMRGSMRRRTRADEVIE